MSKILVNSDIVLRGVKIYAENGVLQAELIGEAATNIGPTNFNISPVALDFNMPEQTAVSSFFFRDGKGRVGYNFNFGDVMFVNKEDEPVEEDTENTAESLEEAPVETEEEYEAE